MTSVKREKRMKALQKMGTAAAKKRGEKRHQILVRSFLQSRTIERRKWRQILDALRRRGGERVDAERAYLILPEFCKHLYNDLKNTLTLQAIEDNLWIKRTTAQSFPEHFDGSGELGSDDAHGDQSALSSTPIYNSGGRRRYTPSMLGQVVTPDFLQRWLASEPDPNDPLDKGREVVQSCVSAVKRWLQKHWI